MTTKAAATPDDVRISAQAQGQSRDLALHTLGWKAFQDLCSQICSEVLKLPVSIYREAQDGGQDAVFVFSSDSTGQYPEGTVQCKFSGNPTRRLQPSDINAELGIVSKLVDQGKAHSYFFITNMGVDGPVATRVRQKLKDAGVIDPHVFGREWLTLKIRESAKLRALVPRVYGLGDLSIILDERRAEQTRALLGHLFPSLGAYVPTSAHRNAVRVLAKHGIVLLLGAPASGKSMLAAILATTALDGEDHRCYQLDGPNEISTHWNPNETGRFYWIDDAFGPNQLRTDFVDTWLTIMNKVKAAIAAGNRFVLTSRLHIWRAAKAKLGMRNHPLLADESAVVNVGALSPEERSQILYNHIKAGTQPTLWKSIVKPHLAAVSRSIDLLPEIARRLGNRDYTAGIENLPADLIRFASEPMEFLKQTIRELNDAQQAALTLVFLSRSRLPIQLVDDGRRSIVADKYGVSELSVGDALDQLNGSFLLTRRERDTSIISFTHPTISDALSAILVERPDLVELYIRGTKIPTLLAEAVCEGAAGVRDAVVIPASMNDQLISRLTEVPDEPTFNSSLFEFLCDRASEPVLRALLGADRKVLYRQLHHYWKISSHPAVRLFARVNGLGLLPADLRDSTSELLQERLLEHMDASFLDDDAFLALIQPGRLLTLSSRLLENVVDGLPSRIAEIAEEADLDYEPEDNFEDVSDFVDAVKEVFEDSSEMQARVEEAEDAIAEGIRDVTVRKQNVEEVEWNGTDVPPAKIASESAERSIFSDVDE